MQTGNRVYKTIERKKARRQHRRANKGPIRKARRTAMKNRMMSAKLRGQF